jgi:four helix bundle protein
MDLAVKMINLADRLIARRRFAIADQITRSAFSVPSNIAEGEGRDRRHYVVQARGSLYELETQLEIITRARLAKDSSGTRIKIKQISAGLSKIITDLGTSDSPTRRLAHSPTRKPFS